MWTACGSCSSSGQPAPASRVHGNQIVALEQKYGGFTYIFDIGGSYESVVELYGGRVDRVGKDGPRVNPFALEPTESNIKFLYSFIKLLLTNGGAELEPEDDDVIHKAVQDMYLLDPENRRLSNLFLPKKLDRYLSKWVGKGIYNAIFDNVEDSLSLSRLQCFDFQGVNNEQYADLIEPLMVWLLRRINDVLYNPANLGVPKHILIEEIFSSMKNKQLLEGALASIKTVRKNLGGVTMIGQSADDLGENADSIVNSCTSFLFLKDATFNRKRYAELFKMNEQQLALFESLQDREGAVHAARRAHQSCHAESRQPQLRHVLHQAERPGTPVEADRKVRTHRGHRRVLPRASLCNQSPTRKDQCHETTHPHHRHRWTCAWPAVSAQRSAAPEPHPLQPNAPRTVTVSEADTPPVIRAGLLQSTLILLPAEEKVANVFGATRWTGSSMAAMSPAASSASSRRLRTARRTFISFPTTATNTPLQLREVSSDADPHFDSKVFIAPGDKAAKDRLTELPVFVPAAELDKAKQEAAAAKAAQAAELKAEETQGRAVSQPVSRHRSTSTTPGTRRRARSLACSRFGATTSSPTCAASSRRRLPSTR